MIIPYKTLPHQTRRKFYKVIRDNVLVVAIFCAKQIFAKYFK